MVTLAELCLNRIESYTAGLSGYKYSTVAVDYNSGVWAFLLRAFALRYRVPFLEYNRRPRRFESAWMVGDLARDGWRSLENNGCVHQLLLRAENPVGSHFFATMDLA